MRLVITRKARYLSFLCRVTSYNNRHNVVCNTPVITVTRIHLYQRYTPVCSSRDSTPNKYGQPSINHYIFEWCSRISITHRGVLLEGATIQLNVKEVEEMQIRYNLTGG